MTDTTTTINARSGYRATLLGGPQAGAPRCQGALRSSVGYRAQQCSSRATMPTPEMHAQDGVAYLYCRSHSPAVQAAVDRDVAAARQVQAERRHEEALRIAAQGVARAERHRALRHLLMALLADPEGLTETQRGWLAKYEAAGGRHDYLSV